MLPNTRMAMNTIFVNNLLVTERSFNLALLELENTIPERYIVMRYTYLIYIHELIFHKYKKEISIVSMRKKHLLNLSKLKCD